MDWDEHDEQALFQTETLRIARQLWPQAEYGGAEIVDGRERDGIFETEECTHLLECTVSRSQDKADKDSKKLVALAKKQQGTHPEKVVKCWFVTKLVGDVLRLLQTEKVIAPYRRAGLDMTIWIPDRSKTSRVTKLITSPRTCKDPLIAKVERL